MKIVVFGLSITSSWGNGHATTYRALLSALRERGHRIVFFEKNEEWYASNRDLPAPEYCEMRFFENWAQARLEIRRELVDTDAAVLGSFFPEGIRTADEIINSNVPVKIFYDIDTPITLEKLKAGGAEYLKPAQIKGFDLYLSFTAGPILNQLQQDFSARCALPLFCSFEPNTYYPRRVFRRYQCDLSYMGTYAPDRQARLDELFATPARTLPGDHFILAGPQYPARMNWPRNIRHIRHLSPRWHPHFYSSSRLTLNVTRSRMIDWGYSPSVRLFEAAACGCAIVSDSWPGLGTILEIGKEVLVAHNSAEIISLLEGADEREIREIGNRARERVLAEHTSTCRAEEFERYILSAASSRSTATHGAFDPPSPVPRQARQMQPAS